MTDDISYVIIEALIRRTLKDIRHDPKRSIRNLVDMAVNFADGHFQSRFFEVAHKMLMDDNSPYYELYCDTVNNVDEDHIVDFGMKVGFNSCTRGAERIRQIEKNERCNIPWTLYLTIDDEDIDYADLIGQGEELGIYTWFIYSKGDIHKVLDILSKKKKSAFFLFIKPEDISFDVLDELMEYTNIMTVLINEEGTAESCRKLREHHLPYSLINIYNKNNAEKIISEDNLKEIVSYHPLFTAFIGDRGVDSDTARKVYEKIIKLRISQSYSTVFWDIIYDGKYVDGVISDEACGMGINEDGQIWVCGKRIVKLEYNIRDYKLIDIFRKIFRKD
ncbi:MAG: hypothetical protein ACI4WM_04905 [Erysipelotrichaceae bacterium]